MSIFWLFVLLVGYANCENAWKVGSQYNYQLKGRTLTGLHQVADQYAGIILKAKLTVNPKSNDVIQLQIHEPQYSFLHANLSQGWSSHINEDKLNYQQLPMSGSPFELKLKNGVVDKMYVDKNIQTYEINMLKGIASQFQIDTNAHKSSNQIKDSGVYKTQEDTVTGECETLYDVSPLPRYVLQSRPELAPKVQNEQVINIVKTMNYSDCDQHMVYHFGISGMTDVEPGSNQMESFLSRSTVSRIVISGSFKEYTIQSSVTTNKIVLAPHLYNSQKGIVVSRMNLTLESISSSSTPAQLSNPRVIKNLVYEYNPASQDENDQKHGKNRSRRSILNHNSQESSSSSSSSSSEEYWQPKPTLKMPPQSPFLPYFIGNQGNSIISSKAIRFDFLVKLAKKIGEEVQNPNRIIGENTLTKFNILTRALRTMSFDQIKEITQQLYYPYKKASHGNMNEAKRYQSWVTFRDATAQAGTGPALLTIKEWIQSQKIQEEEAAELVASLPYTARYPTKEYLEAFFEMATSDGVKNQMFLNTSAIYSFTTLLRSAQVDWNEVHNRYPVHAFGRPSSKDDQTITDKFIPYLENQLKKAVSQGDSIKIQVYIRALGNVAHPKILNVFEPFLEGRQMMSNFQRLTIVASLDKMTRTYPDLARSVLYKIYQNTGEKAQIRVAAVMQIMKSNPTAQMLQRMAQFTNSDHSEQVNSAVKSAIENAASLTTPEWRELCQNAKSAKNLLTTKQFGMHYSKNYYRSYIVKGEEEEGLLYSAHLKYIQGEDSAIPSSLFYSMRNNLGGFKRQSYQFSAVTSSVDDLVDLFWNQFSNDKKQYREHTKPLAGDSKWSWNKVANMLNIKLDQNEQVEGQFLFTLMGGKRFFAFDNHTVEQIPKFVKYASEKLRNGQAFHLTKFYNQYGYKIGFPTAMGLPFLYSFDVPSLAYLGGDLKVKTSPEFGDEIKTLNSVSATGDIQFLYTARTQGKMGFITPFNNQRYSAILEKNIQVHFHINAAFDYDVQNNKISGKVQPMEENREQKLFEYSTVAYTTIHDALNLSPPSESHQTKNIHVRPLKRFETTVGQDQTGFAFDMKAESEQDFMDWASMYDTFKRHDFTTVLSSQTLEKNINNNNFTITYNPQVSTAKYTKFAFKYDTKINDKTENDPIDVTPSSTFDSRERQRDMLKNVGTGIQGSYSRMMDMSVEFGGSTKAQFVASYSFANSPVAEKSRLLVSLSKKPANTQTKPFKALAVITAQMPQVPLINFQKALNTDPTGSIEGTVNFGEDLHSSEMHLNGKYRQSQERQEFVRRHPVSNICQQQMQNGNYIQPACRNATASANLFDQYTFTMEYKNIQDNFKNWIHEAYSWATYLAFPYVKEKFDSQNNKNQVQFDVNFGPDLKSVNISMNGEGISTQFRNVRVNNWIRPIVVSHPQYNAFERLEQEMFNSQQYPTCALDQNTATTFDNRTYPINLGKCWHAMAHVVPKSNLRSDKYYSVLVRESSNQKEVVVLFGDDVVEMSSNGVQYNGEKLDFSKTKMAQYQDRNGIKFQIYELPTGAVRLISPWTGMELIFDGHRIKLQTSNKFRGQIYGLCGTFNGEMADDMTSPWNLVLKNPSLFAASYAIVDTTCDESTKQKHEESKTAIGYKKTVMFGDVISEKEAGRKSQYKTCSHSSTRIITQNGQTCFSTKSYIKCNSSCKPTQIVQKNIDFHCTSDEKLIKQWQHMINKGIHPINHQIKSNHKESTSLPLNCA